VRFLELHESVADTLRDVVENYLQTARDLLKEKYLDPDQEQALLWSILDAEQVLTDLGEPCDCCREGIWSSPDSGAPCIHCKHSLEQHEEYSGPTGSEADITS